MAFSQGRYRVKNVNKYIGDPSKVVAKALGKQSLTAQEATDIENRIKDAMRSLAKNLEL